MEDLDDIVREFLVESYENLDQLFPENGCNVARALVGTEGTCVVVLEATLDVWELPTESAQRVGHPAPFSVELPQRCIELYTYRGDLVLDPFMGSGSTAVAAKRTGRHYVGYDTEPAYVALAEERVAAARSALPMVPPR